MEASYYSYSLTEVNDVCHFVLPNEKEYGMKNTIFRNVPAELPEPFKSQTHLVNKLFIENEPRDVVFMQVTCPGKAFDSFDREKYKLAITLRAYNELLNFFATDYPLVYKRIEGDTHAMLNGSKWLTMSPSISFCGAADICFKKTLEKTIHHDLDIFVERRHELGKRCVTLRYTNPDLGLLYVHPPVLMQLAQERGLISNLQTYKGVPTPKRSRQS